MTASLEPTDILLRHSEDGGILRLVLNDTQRRNALSNAMLKKLHESIAFASDTAETRVIIISATGPAFSAGHDLKEISAARLAPDKGQVFFEDLMQRCSDVMMSIVNCPKPVIAEVNGVATAAGCQLVASCDLAYASDTSRFATPGVNIGLFCSTPMVALSRNVAHKHAMEMLLTGEMINAERAEEIGLINRAVEADALPALTSDIARKISAKSGSTLAIGKRAFYAQREKPLSDAYAYTSSVMVENMLDRDAEEGISAFLEKRSPKWTDG